MAWSPFLIPIVALVTVFTFASVAVWSDNRRKEREASYRHETYQKMLEGSGESAETVRELMREEEGRRQQRRVEGLMLGLKLGGMITAVAGLGLGVFLYFIVPDQSVYLVAIIPLLVGLVLVLYGFHLESRRPQPRSGAESGHESP